MNILVTGGAGYIGSHTIVELISAKHSVVVVDNLCNSSQEALNRVQKITNTIIPFYNIDLRDYAKLKQVFSDNKAESRWI